MFTGIIHSIGTIKKIEKKRDITRITIKDDKVISHLAAGASLAVNGVCLTLVSRVKNICTVEVMEETLKKTTLGNCKRGMSVNLEPPLSFGDLLSGHIIQGHVDTTAKLASIKKCSDKSYLITFSLADISPYVTEKGSIAVDGVSLTIIDISGTRFSVGIIPHTWENTTFSLLRIDDRVNIEFDIVAKYIINTANRKV